MKIRVDREHDIAAVDGGHGLDGASRDAHAVLAALIGLRAVGRSEAGVLGELDPRLRLIGRADEAHEVARDGSVGVGAGRMRLVVDPWDVERPDRLEGVHVDLLDDVGVVRRRVLGDRVGERGDDVVGILAGDLGDPRRVGSRLGELGGGDLGRRARTDRGLGRRGDVVAEHAVGEHDTVES